MLLTSLFLVAFTTSVNAAPLYAPITARKVTGWPFNSNFTSSNSDFGITGGFKSKFLSTVDNEVVVVGNYPKGSYAGSKSPGPGIAGFIFEAAGTEDLGKTVQFSYDVKFEDGFAFAEGGKLPGLYGGSDPATAKTCAGGNHDDSCWSARIMWRADGAGELYAYLPSANQDLPICENKCDVKFGASIDRGAWSFKAGDWTTIMEEVTVGNGSASIKVSVNGKQKIQVDNLVLPGSIRGAMVHTFFGGSSRPDFQSPKDQKAFFRNFAFKTISS
ncbi:hypothetical protein C8J56DRAFT_949795 [Mycena floridula]|nr:hypothetical protein C8J56DRAFT_949795 [Mycena floridula]